MTHYPRLISIPDAGIWKTLDRALRGRIEEAHSAACNAYRDVNTTDKTKAMLDREYEDALLTFEIITGESIIVQ